MGSVRILHTMNIWCPEERGLRGGEEENKERVNGKNTLLFLHWRQHERTGNMEQYLVGQILLSSLYSSMTYREIISPLRAPIALFVWEELRH